MEFQLKSLLSYLTQPRPWKFHRHIMHDNGAIFTVTGAARFVFDPSHSDNDGTSACRYMYEETGKMLMPGQTGESGLETKQSYMYEFPSSSPTTAKVYFSDGRFFHNLDFTASKSFLPKHWCSPDTYEGSFELLSATSFRVRWRVDGPSKHYRSDTLYQTETLA